MITIEQARQELFEVFAANKAGKPRSWINPYVSRIYDHEPFGNLIVKPAAITIHTAGEDPETLAINLEIRVYADATVNARTSAHLIDTIMDTIRLGNEEYGGNISYIPSEYSDEGWEKNFEETIGAWAAIMRVKRGRENF